MYHACVSRPCLRMLLLLVLFPTFSVAHGQPRLEQTGTRFIVRGDAYRASFGQDNNELMLELACKAGWRPLVANPREIVFGLLRGTDLFYAGVQRATLTRQEGPDYIALSRQAGLGLTGGAVQLEYVCTSQGLLIGYRLLQPGEGEEKGAFWAPPRLRLSFQDWDSYAFYGVDGRRHAGRIADLQPYPAYAGVSPWGPQGDTVPRLSAEYPALIVRSEALGKALGVVFLRYEDAWAGGYSFLQRHTAETLYFYAGYAPAETGRFRWAWLAPFDVADETRERAQILALLERGAALLATYQPPSVERLAEWLKPIPDFPAELRRKEPVSDIRQAIIYTINESTTSREGVALAAKTGTDVLIRGWFKWGQRPPVERWHDIPQQIHALGTLFGGGITCSALYANENGLTAEQVADMATRAPDGSFVDAWNQPGVRHGSLSSPAYVDYLFRWCKEQIDAGVDYLFMDESNAALSETEGYDDYSLADFRAYLLTHCPQTRDWAPNDPRWRERYGIPLDDRAVCPDGTMQTFDYRAFLRREGLIEKPLQERNKLAPLWQQFRAFRDDRAWKALTERIRTYARAQGRRVLISGNGLVKYADLQVLGVWGEWATRDGRVDLTENQLPKWRRIVERGQQIAGAPVPVVFFHDWGFGEPPFPWLAVPPKDRELWIRTRGAEIYAAGGFFAFPILGPLGCNAAEDGTLGCIVRQTTFYQRHKAFYLQGRYLGCERLSADGEQLSLAVWEYPEDNTLLVHVINRLTREGSLQPRANVHIRLPIADQPAEAYALSPDWDGQQPVHYRRGEEGLELTLPSFEAYVVAVLRFAHPPQAERLHDPVREWLTPRWARPECNEFRVLPGGRVEGAEELNAFLQGRLHTDLRNSPTFLVHAAQPGRLEVHVRAVASLGAKLEYRVDGQLIQTEELPDRDGKNDAQAAEYNQTFVFEIPAGQHRLSLDNVGGDWAFVEWIAFIGEFREGE